MIEALAIRTLIGRSWGLVGKVLNWVARNPWQSLSAVLGLLLAWLLWFTVPGLEKDLEIEIQAHQETKQAYGEAQSIAAANWAAERLSYEGRLANMTEENDAGLEQARQASDDAISSFIRNNRVQCPAKGNPVVSDAGGPAAASADPGASSVNGPGSVSDLVAVSPADIRICADNTLRLIAGREWALGLERLSDGEDKE